MRTADLTVRGTLMTPKGPVTIWRTAALMNHIRNASGVGNRPKKPSEFDVRRMERAVQKRTLRAVKLRRVVVAGGIGCG